MFPGYQSDTNTDSLNGNASRSASNSTASSYVAAATLKSNTMSPSDTAHTIPSQYADQGSYPTPNSLPNLNHQAGAYGFGPHDPTSTGDSPSMMHSHLQRRHTGHHHQQSLTDGSPLPGMSHSFPMPIERSRSSQGPTMTDSDQTFARYAKRPRANTTASVPIYSSSSSAVPGSIPEDPDTAAANVQTSPGMLTSSSSTVPGLVSGGTTPMPLPPLTPSYHTPSRSFSDSQPQQNELMGVGGISGL